MGIGRMSQTNAPQAGFIARRGDVRQVHFAVAQFAQMIAIIRRPLFWRVAPLLGFTSGVQIGIQTLWAGPWLRDVMGYSREEVAHHLLFMALAFMVGILAVGVIADRLGERADAELPPV